MQLTKTSAGLTIGILLAFVHLLWSILVVTGVAQVVMDWIFKLHMLSNPFQVQAFDIGTALALVAMTFVVGFVMGWLLALLHNFLHKE